MGIGDEYRALPWNLLRYNERLDAYELNVTDNQLRNAPMLTGARAESTVNGNETFTITMESHATGERCTVLKCGWSGIAAPPTECEPKSPESSVGGLLLERRVTAGKHLSKLRSEFGRTVRLGQK